MLRVTVDRAFCALADYATANVSVDGVVADEHVDCERPCSFATPATYSDNSYVTRLAASRSHF